MTEPPAVADAGRLIRLDEVGLAVALDLFPRVMVPRLVASEVRRRPDGPGNRALQRCRIAGATPKLPFRGLLSPGDAAAIDLARTMDAILVTDDLDLRDAARLANVPVVGTIGVMVRAARVGIIPPGRALAALDALIADSTLFITPALIEQAKVALQA